MQEKSSSCPPSSNAAALARGSVDGMYPHHVHGKILDQIVAMVSELEYSYWK